MTEIVPFLLQCAGVIYVGLMITVFLVVIMVLFAASDWGEAIVTELICREHEKDMKRQQEDEERLN